ncbi:MAG: hypothetical protein U1D96_05460 [Eubacteriales bacterium]|nr:hypothetical protein [Clostridia bacterium]MDZ4042928.1 hypothetical protein [Eubacteriales bacterium]
MRPYNRTYWKDHVTDGATVIQQGTPQSATNFNNIEEGVFAGGVELDILGQQLLQHLRLLSDLDGMIGEITLTNSQIYPFNNSIQTVALAKPRDTLNYRVLTEVLSAQGMAGAIRITDKALNGFKIQFTGSATSVTIKYFVQGGMYQ